MHVHFKLWYVYYQIALQSLYQFTVPPIAFKIIYSHSYQYGVSLNFFDFCKCDRWKLLALYYLSLYFFNCEWRGNFSLTQYICILNHILCPFSNGLLYFYLSLYKIFCYVKSVCHVLSWALYFNLTLWNFCFPEFFEVKFINYFLHEFSIWNAYSF